MKTENN